MVDNVNADWSTRQTRNPSDCAPQEHITITMYAYADLARSAMTYPELAAHVSGLGFKYCN